jgi:hypothetical protein
MLQTVLKSSFAANTNKISKPFLFIFLSFEEIYLDSLRVNHRVTSGAYFFLFLSPTSPGVLLKVVFFMPLEPFFNAQVLTKFVLSSLLQTNRGVRPPVRTPRPLYIDFRFPFR